MTDKPEAQDEVPGPVAYTTRLALDCGTSAFAFEVCAGNIWGEKGVPLYGPDLLAYAERMRDLDARIYLDERIRLQAKINSTEEDLAHMTNCRGREQDRAEAAERERDALREGIAKVVTDEMVNRFLTWPLPDSVCVDMCATEPGCPHRIGTNLLTAIEAKQMLEYVLDETDAKEDACPR